MWLKADIHSHSKYSDGDSRVADILADAKTRGGLQLLSITDHDEDQADHHGIATWYDPAYVSSSSLALLHGAEWTTSGGHANIWSTHTYDYSAIWTANRAKDPASAIHLAHDQGALFSYNHPELIYPWSLPTSREVDGIEIWNGPGDDDNNFRATFKLWDGMLKQHGVRINAVGSSDMHKLGSATVGTSYFGNPRLWLLADDANPATLLAALKHGHATISATAASPRLDIAADRDANGSYETRLGDIIPLSSNATVKFKMTLDAGGTTRPIEPLPQSDIDDINARLASGANYSTTLARICDEADADDNVLALIRNGQVFKAWLVDKASQDVAIDVGVDAASKSYFRAELYDEAGRVAVTNPIYVNFTNLAYGTAGNDTLVGEAASDELHGSAGNDSLSGLDGRDKLYGEDGRDSLYGGGGLDIVTGGSGQDSLSGGGGNDTYDFDYLAESQSGSANRDTILEFGGVGATVSDRIDLSSVDATPATAGDQAFAFKGTAAFSGAGQVRVVPASATSTDTLIQANTDATLSTVEMEILVRDGGAVPSQWAASDFIL